MTRMIVHGRQAHHYKEAKDVFDRAVAILEYKRGGTILLCEEAALFHAFLRMEECDEKNGPVWDDVCEAGKLAINGYGIKDGSVRPVAKQMKRG